MQREESRKQVLSDAPPPTPVKVPCTLGEHIPSKASCCREIKAKKKPWYFSFSAKCLSGSQGFRGAGEACRRCSSSGMLCIRELSFARSTNMLTKKWESTFFFFKGFVVSVKGCIWWPFTDKLILISELNKSNWYWRQLVRSSFHSIVIKMTSNLCDQTFMTDRTQIGNLTSFQCLQNLSFLGCENSRWWQTFTSEKSILQTTFSLTRMRLSLISNRRLGKPYTSS